MKITKSAFLGQNSGGTWGDKVIFWVVGGTPTPSPPTRGNPGKFGNFMNIYAYTLS